MRKLNYYFRESSHSTTIILSEGGSEGRERRIFGYTGSTLPTERRRNHRPRCATNRTVCAIGTSAAGVTEDPSLPPLGPTPLRISSQPLSEAKDLRLDLR